MVQKEFAFLLPCRVRSPICEVTYGTRTLASTLPHPARRCTANAPEMRSVPPLGNCRGAALGCHPRPLHQVGLSEGELEYHTIMTPEDSFRINHEPPVQEAGLCDL